MFGKSQSNWKQKWSSVANTVRAAYQQPSANSSLPNLTDKMEEEKNMISSTKQASSYYYDGMGCYKRGEWDHARAHLEAAAKAGDLPLDGLLILGLIYLNQGKEEDAKKLFQTISSSNHNELSDQNAKADASLNLGLISMQLCSRADTSATLNDTFNQAARDFRAALTINSASAEANLFLGMLNYMAVYFSWEQGKQDEEQQQTNQTWLRDSRKYYKAALTCFDERKNEADTKYKVLLYRQLHRLSWLDKKEEQDSRDNLTRFVRILQDKAKSTKLNAEELVILLLAEYDLMMKQDVRNTFTALLNLQPYGVESLYDIIPYHLKADFFLALGLLYSANDSACPYTKETDLQKKKLLDLLTWRETENERIERAQFNAALVSMTKRSLPGSIFYIAQSVLSNPTISSGTLADLVKRIEIYIDKHHRQTIVLSGFVTTALTRSEVYDVALLTNDVNVEPGKFYIHKADMDLEYKVLTPENNIVTGKITQNELSLLLSTQEMKTWNELGLLTSDNIGKASVLLPKFLDHCNQRGHTYHGLMSGVDEKAEREALEKLLYAHPEIYKKLFGRNPPVEQKSLFGFFGGGQASSAPVSRSAPKPVS